MKIFVTGAAGFVGLAMVEELVKNGHEALGLARSDSSAEKIAKAGGQVHRGDLEDVESLRSGAKAADGVIHLAFIHDFSPEGFAKAMRVDQEAIQAMAEAMEGTGKPLVIPSGALVLAGTGESDEDTPVPESDSPFVVRAQSERLVHKLSHEKNIRGSVVRLSPTVHGVGDKGFVPILAGMARGNGFVTNVGDGSTRWPAVHVLDAVALIRLAVEKGKAGGMYHGVAEVLRTGQVMEAIAKKTSLPVESKSVDEAAKLIHFFAYAAASDCPISSEKTKKELGWAPQQIGLLADIEKNYTL